MNEYRIKPVTLLTTEADKSGFTYMAFPGVPMKLDVAYFIIEGTPNKSGYVELPYTLVQDFTLLILMKEKTIDIWKKKLDWIALKGGMVLLNTHPDYMRFNEGKLEMEEYLIAYYKEFLIYIKNKYKDQYWHVQQKRPVRPGLTSFNHLWCRRPDLNRHGRNPLPPQDSVSTKFHHFGTWLSIPFPASRLPAARPPVRRPAVLQSVQPLPAQAGPLPAVPLPTAWGPAGPWELARSPRPPAGPPQARANWQSGGWTHRPGSRR